MFHIIYQIIIINIKGRTCNITILDASIHELIHKNLVRKVDFVRKRTKWGGWVGGGGVRRLKYPKNGLCPHCQIHNLTFWTITLRSSELPTHCSHERIGISKGISKEFLKNSERIPKEFRKNS